MFNKIINAKVAKKLKKSYELGDLRIGLNFFYSLYLRAELSAN